MEKIYKEKPDNFDKIEDIIIVDNEKTLEGFLQTNGELYFYDTCSLQCHSKSISRKSICKFIKSRNGVVIITQTVLIELYGDTGNLEESILDYLREIYENGIKIILFKEENLLYITREITNKNFLECNKTLAFAIGEVSKAKGVVSHIEKALSIKKRVFSEGDESSDLFKEFFQYGLSIKSTGDDLGEELMCICFIVLTGLQVIGKMIFFSNDIKSRATIISVNDYTKKHYGKPEPYQLTSLTLFYKLLKLKFIDTKEELSELIEKSYPSNNKLSIYYTDKYSIDIKQMSLTVEEYVNKVFHEVEFNVIY